MDKKNSTSSSLKKKSVDGLLWAFANRFGSISVNFMVNIILARLLMPSDFGLIAMVLIFFDISKTFVSSGLPAAMIRERELSEADKSTSFFFNILTSLAFYVLLFGAAPWIANFFEEKALIAIVRILGLVVIIGSFTSVQQALFDRDINFKTQAKGRILASAISGVVAVTMALLSFGVWSLVAKMLLSTLSYTFFLWYVSSWRPLLVFSNESFQRLFGFGVNILGTHLIDKFFRHIFQLVIGKFFNSSILGFYAQANNMRNMIYNTLFLTMSQVTYPVLSSIQDDNLRLKGAYKKILKLCSFIIMPVLVLLGSLAEPVVTVLLGEKWLPAAPFLQLLCIATLTQHINSINLNILLVIGRSDLTLRVELFRRILIVLAVFLGLPFGIYGLLVGEVAASFLGLGINAYYSFKYFNYKIREQLSDLKYSFLLSLGLGVPVILTISYIAMPDILKIITGLIIGTSFYLGGHLLAKTEELTLMRHILIPRISMLYQKVQWYLR